VVRQRDRVGLLACRRFLPLVKVIDRHETAAPLECFAEGGPVLDPLGLGVDVREADFDILCPVRHQAPPRQVQATLAGPGIEADHRERVGLAIRSSSARSLELAAETGRPVLRRTCGLACAWTQIDCSPRRSSTEPMNNGVVVEITPHRAYPADRKLAEAYRPRNGRRETAMRVTLLGLFCNVLVAIVSAGNVHADDNCPQPLVQLNKDIKGKIQGDVSTLIKLGKISAAGDIETTTKDFLHEYPNADKIALEQNTLSIICEKVLSSPDFTPQFKQDVINKMVNSLYPAQHSDLSQDILSKIRIGDYGKTSLEFVKSKLGAPVYEGASFARFEVQGYIIEVKFLKKSSVDGHKGQVTAFLIKVDGNDPERPPVRTQDLPFHSKDPTAVIGKSSLKHFTDSCKFDYIGGPGYNKDATYICSQGGLHSDGWIYTTFYLDDNTSNIDLWEYVSLRNYYYRTAEEKRAKEQGIAPNLSDHEDSDIPCCRWLVEKWDKETGVYGREVADKIALLTDDIDSTARNMTVYGIQFSLEDNSIGED
jgi:hypothetical protein